MRKFLLSISLFLGIFLQLSAQVEFVASCKKVVSQNEQFRLVYTVNANASNFRPPNLANFQVLAGPGTSTSSSVEVINGKVSQSYITSFSYILSAPQEGKFTIPSAQVTVGGKNYSSNSLSVEVVKGNSQNNSQTPTNKTDKNAVTGNSNDLFVRVETNKNSAYQGECITATIKIYSRLNLSGFEDMKYPDFNGFWTQDVQTPSQISLEKENVNGAIYNVGVIKQTLLFPQKSGDIVVEPYELTCVAQQKVGTTRDWFGFPVDKIREVRRKLTSTPVKISVKSLPEPKPEYFNGAVGNFTMTAVLDKISTKANEAVNLKITISGNGNLKLAEPSQIDFPKVFEVYDPKIENNIKNNANGSSGNKVISYVVIPREMGEFAIPPVKFSYFDTKKGEYVTLQSDSLKILVTKGDKESSSYVSNVSKEDVKLIGSDIRFINQEKISFHKKGETFFDSTLFYLSYLLALGIFAGILFWRRKYIRENANLSLVKKRQASKVSLKRLRLAANYLKTNEKDKFYTELSHALWGYVSDKLIIPAASLTKDNVMEMLLQRNVDKTIIDNFVEILDTCEYARYAPVGQHSGMENIFAQASSIINKMEENLK